MALNSKLPTNFVNVRTNRHGFQEINSKLLRLNRRQPFEDPVFQVRQPRRQAKFILISRMIVRIQRAADRATMLRTEFIFFPTRSLYNLVSHVVRLEPIQIFLLYCRVTVKCFHLVLPLFV